MSICIGVGEYAYKLNIEGNRNEAEGVYYYNQSDDVENYVRKVESYMGEMGENLDGYDELIKTF